MITIDGGNTSRIGIVPGASFGLAPLPLRVLQFQLLNLLTVGFKANVKNSSLILVLLQHPKPMHKYLLNPKSLLLEQTIHCGRCPNPMFGEISDVVAHPQHLHKTAKSL